VELVYTAGVQTGVHMFAIDVKTGFSKTRNTLFFHGMGTENLRHQFSHLSDYVSDGDIKSF
jgi:hypothetical protein